MIAVIQRVSQAHVTVEGKIVGRIGCGLVILLGVFQNDGDADAAFLADKIAGLRIFGDEQQKMNLSIRMLVARLGISHLPYAAIGAKAAGQALSLPLIQKPDGGSTRNLLLI